MAEEISPITGVDSSSGRVYRLESFWTCCQCERNGEAGILTALENSTCRSEHQRCDSCVVEQVKIFGSQNASEAASASSTNGINEDDDYLLRHASDAPRSRLRGASCDSIFRDRQRRQSRPLLSGLVSWDDAALDVKHHFARSAEEDQLQKGQNMGLALRRTANINVFDDSVSEKSLCSRTSPLPESDSEDELLERRLLHPVEYFRELDDLGSQLYGSSIFHFYRVRSQVVRQKRILLIDGRREKCIYHSTVRLGSTPRFSRTRRSRTAPLARY